MRVVIVLSLFLFACSPAGNRGSSGSASSFLNAVSGLSMRHFVDPETGNISEKLSIPKNYSGNIYLAVDNVDKLSDKHLYARIKFGYLRDNTKIVPVTIGVAPSISSSNMQPVLVLSLSQRPFAAVPLSYDLFDYNSYNFTSSVVSIEQSNRDKDLYCRGLRIDDDPTNISGTCSAFGDKCLYGFAKLEDKTWYDEGNLQSVNIINPQIAVDGNIAGDLEKYSLDDPSKYLSKCLSDEESQGYYPAAGGIQLIGFGDSLNINGNNYVNQGPYKPVNSFQWEIKSSAIWNSQFGLFQQFLGPVRNLESGYKSLMFPRYSKLLIKPDVEYLGAEKAGDPTELLSELGSDGKTFWMSGCNFRQQTKDYKNEHIGSCNVSAQIEIFYMEDGKEAVVASSQWDDYSKNIKLQLLQEAEMTSNTSILNPAYKTCSTDSACAGNECCFNGRCWSDSLVNQCGGTQNSMKPEGESCGTDTECFSLCCSGSTCQPHNPVNGILCNKPNGAACVVSEMCSRTTITHERIIRTGNGGPGECRRRICKACVYRDCNEGTQQCQNRPDEGENIVTVDFNDNEPDCSNAQAENSLWVCTEPFEENTNSAREAAFNNVNACDSASVDAFYSIYPPN